MSGQSIVTKGLIEQVSSGGGTGPAPTITYISPLPNTQPGATGGMPTVYADAANTPLVVEIDYAGTATLSLGMIAVRFLDGTYEVAYRDGFFSSRYAAASRIDGTTFTIQRVGGWPGGNFDTNRAIELLLDIVDSTGAHVSDDVFFLMPTQSGLVRPPAPVVTALGAADVIGDGLNRLIWQFRS